MCRSLRSFKIYIKNPPTTVGFLFVYAMMNLLYMPLSALTIYALLLLALLHKRPMTSPIMAGTSHARPISANGNLP